MKNLKNKNLLWNIALMVLPLLAAGVAAMPNSVTLMQEPVQYCSFFGTFADGSRPFGLAFAGLMIFVLFFMVVLYVSLKKKPLLNGATWVALVAATLAVLPLLLRTEPLVLPNVFVALLLCAEAMLTWVCYKKKEPQPKISGKRLKKK